MQNLFRRVCCVGFGARVHKHSRPTPPSHQTFRWCIHRTKLTRNVRNGQTARRPAAGDTGTHYARTRACSLRIAFRLAEFAYTLSKTGRSRCFVVCHSHSGVQTCVFTHTREHSARTEATTIRNGPVTGVLRAMYVCVNPNGARTIFRQCQPPVTSGSNRMTRRW